MAFDFEKPQPLADAVADLSGKTPVGTALKSAALAKLPQGLLASAQFSAGVESARAMQRVQDGLMKILTHARNPETGAYEMDRSKLIAEVQKLANAEGLRTKDQEKRGSIEDFGSERRTKLILEQQIGAAQGRAFWLQGQDPDVLDAWPAQELVRIREPKGKRRNWPQKWKDKGGPASADGRMIALKTDPIWAAISRFGRPYPPFDYNSGMGTEEIDREAAEARGLVQPGEKLQSNAADYAEQLAASMAGLSPEMRASLQKHFGNQIAIEGETARWVNPKGIDPDVTDATLAHIDENQALPAGKGEPRRDPVAARRIGEAAREGFRAVWPEWGGPGVPADEAALRTGIEAQVAASCLGTKPLYFEPWGGETAEVLAEELKTRLPVGVEIHEAAGNLLIYRPERVRPILDSDPAFYRPNGEDDLSAIARVSAAGNNGELLGYGARNWFEPHGARVLLTTADGQRYMFFVSKPEEAEFWAKQRAQDIADYTGTMPEIDIQRP